MTPDPAFASDCWGRLNDVADVAPVLTVLDHLPDGFRQARRAMLADLGLVRTGRVLEAGSGPGTALPDLLDIIGPDGAIVGVDPTRALVERATARAREAGARNVTYSVGDIRALEAADASVDAAFCDKILVHVSPVAKAVAELARVTRSGGRVGLVEWFSQGMMMAAADYGLTRRILDGSAPAGALNPMTPLELEAALDAAGLIDVRGGSVLAETHRYLPGVKTMLSRRAQQAVDLGAVLPEAAASWLEDLDRRDSQGRFYWAAVVRYATARRP